MKKMQRCFISVNEPKAGFKWRNLFNERWPAYRAWLKTGGPAVDYKIAVAKLRAFMPEMSETHERLCHLVQADKTAISFLTGFQPPAYNSACSQAVSTKDTIQLVRNYDYHPDRFEGVLLMTAWNGKKVIANSDCLLGVLDGMNDDGLAISLTFGGREIVGFGFGVPFILRYILEFCSNVEEAIEVLLRVPSHMSYNVTVADKSGTVKTIEISPDRPPVVTEDAFSTNHQGEFEPGLNADLNQTARRAEFLAHMLSKEVSGEALTNSFLQPPLFNRKYTRGLGTLYTAAYFPMEGMMQLHWPNVCMVQSFDSFKEGKIIIKFNQTVAAF